MITFGLHGAGDGPQGVSGLDHHDGCLGCDGDRIGRSVGLATKRQQTQDHPQPKRKNNEATTAVDGGIQRADPDRGLLGGEPVAGDGGLEGVGKKCCGHVLHSAEGV